MSCWFIFMSPIILCLFLVRCCIDRLEFGLNDEHVLRCCAVVVVFSSIVPFFWSQMRRECIWLFTISFHTYFRLTIWLNQNYYRRFSVRHRAWLLTFSPLLFNMHESTYGNCEINHIPPLSLVALLATRLRRRNTLFQITFEQTNESE